MHDIKCRPCWDVEIFILNSFQWSEYLIKYIEKYFLTLYSVTKFAVVGFHNRICLCNKLTRGSLNNAKSKRIHFTKCVYHVYIKFSPFVHL